MASVRPDASSEEILRSLTEQAQALWGQERAVVIARSIEQTAQQLEDVSRTLPKREVEPGFYQ